MLTKKELNFLNALLEKEGIQSKKRLEDFIWRNTIQPKYKIGDVVKFNDYDQYHYGVHPVGWVGVITDIKYWYDWNKQRVIRYEITYQSKVRNSDEVNKHKTYQNEEEIISKCKLDRINIVDKPRNKNSDYFCI